MVLRPSSVRRPAICATRVDCGALPTLRGLPPRAVTWSTPGPYIRGMTFNDDSQLSGGKVKRRGRTAAIGGGAVGGLALLVYIVSAVSGVDLTGVLGGGDGLTTIQQGGDTVDAAPECRTGRDANASVDCRMEGAAESLDAYWSAEAPRLGISYTTPTFYLFQDSTDTGCGTASSATGRSTVRRTGRSTSTRPSTTSCSPGTARPGVRSRRCTSSRTSGATTSSSCRARSPTPTARARAPRRAVSASSCRPTATPARGSATPRRRRTPTGARSSSRSPARRSTTHCRPRARSATTASSDAHGFGRPGLVHARVERTAAALVPPRLPAGRDVLRHVQRAGQRPVADRASAGGGRGRRRSGGRGRGSRRRGGRRRRVGRAGRAQHERAEVVVRDRSGELVLLPVDEDERRPGNDVRSLPGSCRR